MFKIHVNYKWNITYYTLHSFFLLYALVIVFFKGQCFQNLFLHSLKLFVLFFWLFFLSVIVILTLQKSVEEWVIIFYEQKNFIFSNFKIHIFCDNPICDIFINYLFLIIGRNGIQWFNSWFTQWQHH
jgi:hypothetical protein